MFAFFQPFQEHSFKSFIYPFSELLMLILMSMTISGYNAKGCMLILLSLELIKKYICIYTHTYAQSQTDNQLNHPPSVVNCSSIIIVIRPYVGCIIIGNNTGMISFLSASAFFLSAFWPIIWAMPASFCASTSQCC